MNTNNHLVTAKSFSNVAKSLAASSEVKLIFGGNRAATNGKIVYLPLMREMDKKMSDITLGFLVHEIAHIRFTDFKIGIDGFFNVFEDIRIEKKIRSELKGAEHLFQQVTDFAVNLRLSAPVDTDPFNTVCSWLIVHAQNKVLGRGIKQREILLKVDSDLIGVWGDIRPMLNKYLERSKYLTDCASAKRLSEDLIKDLSKLESMPQQGEPQQDESQQGGSGYGFSKRISEGATAEDAIEQVKKELNDMFADNADKIITQRGEIEEIAGVNSGVSNIPECVNENLISSAKETQKSLTRAVKTLIEAETRDSRYTAKHGKIATSRLTRTVTGQSDIFYRKQEGKGIDTAVTVAVDMSGSMQADNRSVYALTAKLGLIEALNSVSGVTVRGILFPGITSGYAVEQCVGRGKKPNPALSSLKPRGGTPLIEAITDAKDELVMTSAKKRVLIVITDAVVNQEVANRAEEIAERNNIDARFICIKPKQMRFKKGIAISDPSELGQVLLKSAKTLFV